jgi:iron transport multicopper oxidase
LFDAVPDGLNPNITGWLTYDNKAEFPEAKMIDEFDPFDDFALVPVDKQELLGEPDQTVSLELLMDNLGDGAN